MVELIAKLEFVLQELFPLLGELFCLAVFNMNLSEFVEEALLPLELVHGTTLGFYLLFDPIGLIDKIIINLNEFRILYLVNMWTLSEIQSRLLELLFSHLILKFLLPLRIVFLLLCFPEKWLGKLLVEGIGYGFLEF